MTGAGLQTFVTKVDGHLIDARIRRAQTFDDPAKKWKQKEREKKSESEYMPGLHADSARLNRLTVLSI